MDAARRWQVVTAVTAVTGIGLGALALGDQPAESVPPIELEPGGSAPTPVEDADDRADAGTSDPDGNDPEIVSPTVRSLDTAADAGGGGAGTAGTADAGGGAGAESAGAGGADAGGAGADTPAAGSSSPASPAEPADTGGSPASADSAD